MFGTGSFDLGIWNNGLFTQKTREEERHFYPALHGLRSQQTFSSRRQSWLRVDRLAHFRNILLGAHSSRASAPRFLLRAFRLEEHIVQAPRRSPIQLPFAGLEECRLNLTRAPCFSRFSNGECPFLRRESLVRHLSITVAEKVNRRKRRVHFFGKEQNAIPHDYGQKKSVPMQYAIWCDLC